MYQGIFRKNGSELVALGIQFPPQHILQFVESHIGNRRYKDHREVVRQCLLQHLDEFRIQQVTFRDGKDTVLVEQFRIKLCEFVEQDIILLLDVVRVTRHHEEQQRVTLDMAQEAQAQSLSLTGTLDDAGDVRHHERLIVAVAHDTQ